MKRYSILISCLVFGVSSLWSQAFDIGLFGGGSFYEDTTGYSGAVGARYVFSPVELAGFAFEPAAGLDVAYEEASRDKYESQELSILGVGSVDWEFFPNLAARLQLGLGAGYLDTTQTDWDVSVDNWGFILFPQVGVDYTFGEIPLKVILTGGPYIRFSEQDPTLSMRVNLGVSYRFGS